MKKEICHRVGIQATPAAVYQALTDTKKLALWWTTDVRGETQMGKPLEFWFGHFCQQMDVIALEPNKSVRWKAGSNGLVEWKDTEIHFSIVPAPDQTFVYFKHDQWSQDNEMFPQYSMKWAVFLLSLKEFLETGKGHPSPHDVPIEH